MLPMRTCGQAPPLSAYDPVPFTIDYPAGTSGRDIMILIPEPELAWMVIPVCAIWTLRRRRGWQALSSEAG